MKQLQEADLVTSEKRGRWVYYDLNPIAFERVSERLREFGATSPVRGG